MPSIDESLARVEEVCGEELIGQVGHMLRMFLNQSRGLANPRSAMTGLFQYMSAAVAASENGEPRPLVQRAMATVEDEDVDMLVD